MIKRYFIGLLFFALTYFPTDLKAQYEATYTLQEMVQRAKDRSPAALRALTR